MSSMPTLTQTNTISRRHSRYLAGYARCSAAVAIALVGLGTVGCSTMSTYQEAKVVPIEGDEPAGPISVRVDNVAGDVRVRTSWGIDRPQVTVRARAIGDIGTSTPESLVQLSAYSSTRQGLVLQVVAVATPGYEDRVAADIDIYVPALVDIQVRTTNGQVRAIGATGAIDIQVGTETAGGGNIDVRAANELVESARLITTDGNIHLAVPPGSTGAINFMTLEGNAEVRAASSPVSNVRAARGTWTGTIAQGSNSIFGSTNSGYVRMIVMNDPVSYMPSK